jgi:diguanylate cyclase (GGDEF)-like protein
MIKAFALGLLIFFSFIYSFAINVQAQENYTISNNDFHEKINRYSSLNVNGNNALNIDEVLALPEKQWHQSITNERGIFLPKGKNWLTFDLDNTSNNSISLYLSLVDRLSVDHIKLFAVKYPHPIQEIPLQLSRNKLLFGQLIIDKQERRQLFLFIDSKAKLNFPLTIASNNAFNQQNNNKHFTQGFSLGGMAFLSLILLSLSIVTSNKIALLLFGYFISRTLFLSALLGGDLYYYLGQTADIKGFELPILTAASSIFLLWFGVYLFKLKNIASNSYLIIKLLCAAFLAYIPLSLQLDLNTNIFVCLSMQSFALLVLTIIGLLLFKQAIRLSRLFTMVMFIQFIFSLINIINANSQDLSSFDQHTLLYSFSFWSSCFLIIFLFSREFYSQLKEQQNVQKQLLASTLASQKNQEELLRLQQETQEQLEERVQEHTLELHVALQELEEANRELTEKNTQDELTGLYNRRFYDQKILAEHRRSRRNLTPLSLIIIDIDHFKHVNDTYGHLAGDHCLKQVAKQLKLTLNRTSDSGCRYGGEEFCIILPETDQQGAFNLAETLRTAIEALHIEYDSLTITLTISCGLSTYQQQTGILPEHIFAAADKALYLAKHQGRNQTQQMALRNEQQNEENNTSAENINE